jgi:hypothetical protein
VLIFDQFEEFFFANPDPVDRRVFFEFVVACLELQPSALKIVLSLREDYIHYLLEARQAVRRSALPPGSMARSQLEDILGKQILYAIGNFSPEDATAIINSLAAVSRMYLEPALIDALVADLAGPLQEVRPIEMQIVGAQLQTEGIQTLAQYRRLGDQPKETLVQRYLQDVVEDCGEEHRQLAELVLFLLTDERGTRPLKTRPELVRDLEALGIPLSPAPLPASPPEATGEPGVPDLDLVLRILCGSGIGMLLPDSPDDRYQLVHDYLAGVIRDRQAPQLAELRAELEEEKQKRREAEAGLMELTAATAAARVEQAELTRKNQQARRFLTGTVAVAALVVTGAGYNATVAQGKANQVRESTRLERAAVAASQRFAFQETEGLLVALRAVSDLRELNKELGITDLASYPTTSPLLALQTSLDNIRETRLIGHQGEIGRVVFSSDGTQIATSGEDGTARLWDLNGNQLAVMEGHQGTTP